jgi:hypothetical protein
MHLGYLSALSKTISVTPNDANDLPNGFKSRAISCGTNGTIAYVNEDNVESVLNALAGVLYPIACKRIKASGTSATAIQAHA